jgi:aspartate dehydrogenase
MLLECSEEPPIAKAHMTEKEQRMTKRIGVVGYGRLGSYLVNKINGEENLIVEFVFDIDKDKLCDLEDSLVLDSMEEAREREADLIVEVATSEWVTRFAPLALEFADLLIFSVTAFAEEGLKENLDAVAEANKTHYYISHGAIIGLDGVRDGKDLLEDVRITTIRPQEGYGLKERVSKRTVLYDGPTRKACQLFPRNVNIHASLALHGLGFDKTYSTVIADPEARVMRHILEVRGRGLAWTIDVQGKPLGERTAAHVPESVFQTVKRICTREHGMILI